MKTLIANFLLVSLFVADEALEGFVVAAWKTDRLWLCAIFAIVVLIWSIWGLFGGGWWPLDTIKKNLEGTGLQKSKFPKIKFKDSGWVLFYVICGWINCVCSLIIVLIGSFGGSLKSSVITALPFLFAGLGSLLAAHILRLLEKGVHHLKSIDENKKPPN